MYSLVKFKEDGVFYITKTKLLKTKEGVVSAPYMNCGRFVADLIATSNNKTILGQMKELDKETAPVQSTAPTAEEISLEETALVQATALAAEEINLEDPAAVPAAEEINLEETASVQATTPAAEEINLDETAPVQATTPAAEEINLEETASVQATAPTAEEINLEETALAQLTPTVEDISLGKEGVVSGPYVNCTRFESQVIASCNNKTILRQIKELGKGTAPVQATAPTAAISLEETALVQPTTPTAEDINLDRRPRYSTPEKELLQTSLEQHSIDGSEPSIEELEDLILKHDILRRRSAQSLLQKYRFMQKK